MDTRARDHWRKPQGDDLEEKIRKGGNFQQRRGRKGKSEKSGYWRASIKQTQKECPPKQQSEQWGLGGTHTGEKKAFQAVA